MFKFTKPKKRIQVVYNEDLSRFHSSCKTVEEFVASCILKDKKDLFNSLNPMNNYLIVYEKQVLTPRYNLLLLGKSDGRHSHQETAKYVLLENVSSETAEKLALEVEKQFKFLYPMLNIIDLNTHECDMPLFAAEKII